MAVIHAPLDERWGNGWDGAVQLPPVRRPVYPGASGRKEFSPRSYPATPRGAGFLLVSRIDANASRRSQVGRIRNYFWIFYGFAGVRESFAKWINIIETLWLRN